MNIVKGIELSVRNCGNSVDAMDCDKSNRNRPSSSDCLDVMLIMEGNESSPRNPHRTVDWTKIKEGSFDEDYEHTRDHARISEGQESSSWNGSDSIDWVKTEVGGGPSVQDPADSSDHTEDEEGEEQCTMFHQDLVIKQIKIEDEDDITVTETQALTTASLFEDKEKPLATHHQTSLEGEIIEYSSEGNGAGSETENLQMNPKRWAIQCKKKNATVDGQGLATELEKKLTHLYHRIIPHTECWESLADISCFLTGQSTNMTLHKCTYCEKSFFRHSQFMAHMKTHTKEKPFPCSICGECFTSNLILIQHRKSHTQRRYIPHTCSDCGKSFSRSSALAYHLRIHTGEKPYECIECKKKFRDTSALLVHQRIHIGSKPYECTECKKTFIQSSALKRHQMIHTGVKAYKCRVCNQSFSQSATLESHQMMHKRE